MAKSTRQRRKNTSSKSKKWISIASMITGLILIMILSTCAVKVYQDSKSKLPTVEEIFSPKEASPPVENKNPTQPNTTNTAWEAALFENFSLSYPTVNKAGELIEHSAYTLFYDEPTEQAAWVIYKLESTELNGAAERSDNFKIDPKVSTGSAHPDDYLRSGYDRGHLAPAADFSFSETAMQESFYMSNMSPQAPSFNRGIWKKLETQVRYWASQYETLYIVTGPVFEQSPQTIGSNQVAVPTHYYKVIYDLKGPKYQAIAFIFENKKLDRPLTEFIVSVDSVESLTQIDFFPYLPDSLENILESKATKTPWFEE
ncbi:DNA/RNA non-specific endonuclease [Penaeicola halotolerans]|uniref:DNA/RNA non-specific endonuclease n=1 Tax=Penaeicola halotolerans TaxID=2793196 RepID=UPI001CF905F7|nr:DNA/RNA non-specific endonuclease [Penaeicola halotolerans]